MLFFCWVGLYFLKPLTGKYRFNQTDTFSVCVCVNCDLFCAGNKDRFLMIKKMLHSTLFSDKKKEVCSC